MKKSTRTGIAFLGLVMAGLADSALTAQETGFLTSPPRIGRATTFKIDPALSQSFGNAQSVVLNLYTDLFNLPDTLSMTLLHLCWQVSYTLMDTSVKAIFYDFTMESYTGDKSRVRSAQGLWDAMVVDGSGRPVLGAHQAIALSYAGSNEYRPEDLDRVNSELVEELRLYPHNYTARTMQYSAWLKKRAFSADIKRRIALEVDSLLTLPGAREPVMNFAIGVYRLLGENDKAQVLEKSLIAQNPGGERAAMKRFSEIVKTEGAAQKLSALDKFLSDFPGSKMTEPALAQVAASAIELEDTTAMIRCGDRLLQSAVTLAGANGLAGIAGVFADGRFELNRAQAYAGKALDLARSSSAGGTDPEREEERRNAEAQYRDVLGWVLLQRDQISGALSELQESAKTRLQVKTFMHYAEALERAGRKEDALAWFGRAAAFSGPVGDAAYEAFKVTWKTAGKDTLQMDSFLNEQAQWVEKASRDRILERKAEGPAPDFRLQDSRGGWVRLSDQRGNAVLLCFWGTWSKSSQALLKSLERLTDQYGQSVLFLTVAMDLDPDAVRQFARKEGLILPVLLNDGQERLYKLEGVPMIFLIDRNGEIRFTHRGYRKDINSILSVELEDILGATAF